MSDLRKSTGPMRLAIKSAVRRAILMAGGGESVQHSTRVKAAALCRYGLPGDEHADNHCPLDVALDLDLEAGTPVILSALAEAHGYKLEKIDPQASEDASWIERMGRMGSHLGEIFTAIGDALKDGKIDRIEAAVIVGIIDKTMDLLRALKERVQAEAGK